MIYYFGTFNPIHKGHIQIANQIENIFDEPVCFVPAFNSPWKPNLTSFDKRVDMIKLCGQRCDTIEEIKCLSKIHEPTYTSETVKKIKERDRIHTRLKFIIGYDQFFNIEKWHDWEYLRDNCFFIVIPRKGEYNIDSMLDKNFNFVIAGIKMMDISSTEIRNGNREFVPEEVENYISACSLYSQENELRKELHSKLS